MTERRPNRTRTVVYVLVGFAFLILALTVVLFVRLIAS